VKRLEDAQREVLGAMALLPEVEVSIADAVGLVVASDVIAAHSIPPFANSGMDGFAVRADDFAGGSADLLVIEDLPAGSVATQIVGSGTTIKIMTGAPMPEGADAIVMVEHSEMSGPDRVHLRGPVAVGQHVRPVGGDVRAGDLVVGTGTRLTPFHIGLLAAVGVSRPTVRRRPIVSVLSTGDELVPSEATELRPGAIRDSNRPMLIALLEELGVDVLDLGILPDDDRLLRAALGEAADASDAVLTSGGVSMGEYDLVKQVLTSLGHVEFWRVAMQPAKPFAFGFLDQTPLFGLPGNPVSVAVAFEQFVRPALLHRMGATKILRRRSSAIAGDDFATTPDKTVFLRVSVAREAGQNVVRSAGGQSSNVLSALAAADAFAVVPVGVGEVGVGDTVAIEWFRAPEARTIEEALGE